MSLSVVNAAAVAVVLWTVAGFGSLTAQAEEPTAAGLWEKVDASGRPDAWFRIMECGGTFEGQIVKMFPKPGEPDPSQWRCTSCQGEQKNAPVTGITFIRGMRRRGLIYENGTILDPRDGSIYSARMELSPDGNQLTVRGYLGISLLGQSQVWRRIRDDRLEGSPPSSCGHRSRSSDSAETCSIYRVGCKSERAVRPVLFLRPKGAYLPRQILDHVVNLARTDLVLESFEYGARCVLGLDRRVREERDYARKELLARADFLWLSSRMLGLVIDSPTQHRKLIAQAMQYGAQCLIGRVPVRA
jgi:uncharacterized protein (DUF2147 family)